MPAFPLEITGIDPSHFTVKIGAARANWLIELWVVRKVRRPHYHNNVNVPFAEVHLARSRSVGIAPFFWIT